MPAGLFASEASKLTSEKEAVKNMISSSECNLASTSGSDTDVSLATDDEMKCSLLRFEYS